MLKKGITIWSFPGGTPIATCMRQAKDAGFEGIELAFDIKGELSMESSDEEIRAIGREAERIGIQIAGLAFARYGAYSLSSNHEGVRKKADQVIRRHLEAAKLLGVECILVVPARGDRDLGEDPENPVPGPLLDYEVAYNRAIEGLKALTPYAEELGVTIGVENVWNGILLSPLEMRDFIDKVGSPRVGAYLDVGNMVLFSYPEQWIRVLDKRIRMVHFKDFRRNVGTMDGFVDLLEGDVNFEACIRAFDAVGYSGWAFAEMWPPYATHPELTIRFTSMAMDKIFGKA